MGHDHEMNVTNMLWRPKLLRLTQVPYPSEEEGMPELPTAPCFVDPQHIVLIGTIVLKFKQGASRICTAVYTQNGPLNVEESPEVVAKMCDEAFGFKDEPPPGATPLRPVK